jgi:hypothetical protein
MIRIFNKNVALAIQWMQGGGLRRSIGLNQSENRRQNE